MATTGRLRTIIGPMFSGKCLAQGTSVLRIANHLMPEIVPIESVTPGDLLLDENWKPARISTISSNVSTLQDPLYHVEYDAGHHGRTSIVATLDHLAVIDVGLDDITAPVDMKVRDIIANAGKYGAIVSTPITGRPYYGITLEDGYHFLIMPQHGDRPVPTHNSSLLVNQIERYHIAGKKCIIIKHAMDLRDGGALSIQTHDNHVHSLVPVQYSPNLICPEIDKLFAQYDVIGIDEIQFFAMYNKELGTQIARYLNDWVARGKIVICAGLDADWKCDAFGVIEPLIVRSDHVEKLSAICMRCGKKASFSARTLANGARYDNPVGGSEKYIALCRACYQIHMKL